MAVDANAFKTSTGAAAYVNPVIYDSEAVKYMYDREVFRPLGIQDSRMLEKPGKQFNKALEGAWSVSALTEGTATPISAYSVSQVTVTFAGYGDAKQFTYEELNYGFDFLMNNAKYNALGALAINRDAQIVTELLTTTTTGHYPLASGVERTSSTITVTDIMTGEQIIRADTAMMQSQARRCKAVVLHPIQLKALRNDSDFIDYSKNPVTANQILRTGEVGSYQGISIYWSNRITSATENSITVYKAIALGENQPFVFMQKRNPEFKWAEENLRDRAITFHYWEMFGVSILVEDSVMVLTSA